MTPPRAATPSGASSSATQKAHAPVGEDLDQRDHQVGAHHVEAAVGQVHDAGDAEDQRHPDRDQEEEHADAEAAHHLHGDERPVGDPGEEAGDEVQAAPTSSSRRRPPRSFATSSQLRMTSLPWVSSTSASDRLALGVHLDHADPLRRDGLLVAAPHDHLAPREVHLVALAERGDDLVGVGALRPLDGLGDDVRAGVAPRGAERGLLLGPRPRTS